MSKYTLIESRDVFESRDAQAFMRLARDLKEQGNEVTLFLVQNAVLAARPSEASAELGRLHEIGIAVLADHFALRERGLDAARLAAGVQAAELDIVIDHMTEGRKVIWH